MSTVLINGCTDQAMDPQDRGLHFGDGVFETIAVIQGIPQYWDEHMQRLLQGCRTLAIPLPDTNTLHREALSLLGSVSRAVIKVIITRGTGGQGYTCPDEPLSTRLVFRKAWPTYRTDTLACGVQAGFSNISVSYQPHLAGIKHLNALEQVLASQECSEKGWDECIRLDTRGCVIEGSKSNLFLVKDGCLQTPALLNCGITGIMRQAVMEKACEMKLDSMEKDLRKDDILQADELFFTNSLMGIWPVSVLNGQQFPVGPLTGHLIEALNIRDYYHSL